MAEAREGALGARYENAHDIAIDAQNDYRDERGQKGHRRPAPDDGGPNEHGVFEVEYDNGYSEEWIPTRADKNSIGRIGRFGGS